MTGPEHYREAERIINAVGESSLTQPESFTAALTAAQVHATLALAEYTRILANGADGTWRES